MPSSDPAATGEDQALIRECYALARSAVAHGDHPFGAILVRNGLVILKSENSVSTERDPTRHAELVLVSQAWRRLGPQALTGSTLYTSTEPCVMCAGAIYWGGIRKVVYGVSGGSVAALANAEYVIPCREVFARIKPRVAVVGPVVEDEGMAIHREFWPGILGQPLGES